MKRLSAGAAVEAVADRQSYRPWDIDLKECHPKAPEYAEEIRHARDISGAEEAVVVGEATIGGVRVAILAWEFAFLGGSVGVDTASRIVAAVRRARAEGLPLVALTRSGGTRMQEGAPAFVQMVAIAGALAEHRAAGLPYLVHLGDPTAGGVLATLGSAGDITTAEPAAMVGFLGPRAYAAITGQQFPPGVQTAENLLSLGLVDAVLSWQRLPGFWARLLQLWSRRVAPGRRGAPRVSERARSASVLGGPQTAAQLWQYVQVSRRSQRVDPQRFLAEQMHDLVVLPGTGQGDLCEGALVGIGRLGDLPVVVIATLDRSSGAPLTVGGLRTARRGIALAQRWGLPVVTVVDTLGAQLSVAGEQSGIAGEISRVMMDLVSCTTPTAALLLGAGTGGAALALLAVDRIVAGSHAWVAPLAPEGAAAIRRGGSHDPALIAWEQRIGAHALAELGFIDEVVRESEPDWVARAAGAVAQRLLEVIEGHDPGLRHEKYVAWPT